MSPISRDTKTKELVVKLTLVKYKTEVNCGREMFTNNKFCAKVKL